MCLVCTAGLGLLESKLNKENVMGALFKVCGLFQNAHIRKCRTTVDTFINRMIEIMVGGGNPEAMCLWMGLCDKTDGIPNIKHQDWLIASDHHGDVDVN